MLIITEYDDGVIAFQCTNCDNMGVYNFSDKITDNCAFIVEPTCRCGNKGKLYFLHCSTESLSGELLAEFESLKLK